MPRSKKVKLSPEQKKQARKIRAQLRRETGVEDRAEVQVAARSINHDEQFWAGTRDRLAAMKILNGHRERPFWVSIPKDSGTPPQSGYFPCSMFSRNGRWYYGFLFREHREAFFSKHRRARKETTQ